MNNSRVSVFTHGATNAMRMINRTSCGFIVLAPSEKSGKKTTWLSLSNGKNWQGISPLQRRSSFKLPLSHRLDQALVTLVEAETHP